MEKKTSRDSTNHDSNFNRRLSVDINVDLHKKLKLMATGHNTTIATLIRRAVMAMLKREEQYK